MSSTPVDYEIVIVGAGPAGLSTALNLAKADHRLVERCVVLESKAHPRDKLCAGGLTPYAVTMLRDLGAAADALPRLGIREVRVRLASRHVVIHGNPYCFEIARRTDLDAMLADLLAMRGGHLHENTTVQSVSVMSNHVEVQTDRGGLRCRAVVGADGARSVVRKSLWPTGHEERVVGVQYTTESATGSAGADAVFDFTPRAARLAGYWWDFPTLDGRRAIGIFAHGDVQAATRYLRESLARMGVDGADSVPVRAARVRAFDPRTALARPRVLLAGDAAGTDPLLGEGVSFALGYGELAGRALAQGFAADELGFESFTPAVLAHPIGRCLIRRLWFYRMLAAPGSLLVIGPLWSLVVAVGCRSVGLRQSGQAGGREPGQTHGPARRACRRSPGDASPRTTRRFGTRESPW